MRYLDVIIYREYCSDFANILVRIEPREIVMKPIQEVIHHSKNRIINSPSAKALMALLGPVLFLSKHKVCTARLAKRVAYPFHFFNSFIVEPGIIFRRRMNWLVK